MLFVQPGVGSQHDYQRQHTSPLKGSVPAPIRRLPAVLHPDQRQRRADKER
jgi:hypothetical protein